MITNNGLCCYSDIHLFCRSNYRSGTDLVSLLILLLLFSLWRTLWKKPKAPSFQIGSGWNLSGSFCFSRKYTSSNMVRFLIWCVTLSRRADKMSKCYHLLSAHKASAATYAAASVNSWSIVDSYLLFSLSEDYASMRSLFTYDESVSIVRLIERVYSNVGRVFQTYFTVKSLIKEVWISAC